MFRKNLRLCRIAALGTAVVALCAAACSSTNKTTPKQLSVTVTPQRGTYKLGDLTVTMPAGAVPAKTTLRLQQPSAMPSTHGPLAGARKAAVQFDLSLSGGAEPRKPIDVAIPLAGAFLPRGMTPKQALLYTPGPHGKGWQLVPALVDAENVLHASLYHLSPKAITYSPALSLQDAINSGGLKALSSGCNQDTTTATTGKVMLGGSGWSTKPASPVYACLQSDGTHLNVRIDNHYHYMWSIASTTNVATVQTDDPETAIVKLLATGAYGSPKVKTYLATDETANVSITADDLPATIELRADPSTFMAENAWLSIKLAFSLFMGENGNTLLKGLETAFKVLSVQQCIESTLKTIHDPNANNIGQAVLSDCGEAVAKALGRQYQNTGEWNAFWGSAFTGGGIAVDGINQLITAAAGTWAQFKQPITVVANVACPNDSDFVNGASKYFRDNSLGSGKQRVAGIITCFGLWAVARMVVTIDSHGSPVDEVYYGALHWKNSAWVFQSGGSDNFHRSPICSQLPSAVWEVTSCGG